MNTEKPVGVSFLHRFFIMERKLIYFNKSWIGEGGADGGGGGGWGVCNLSIKEIKELEFIRESLSKILPKLN